MDRREAVLRELNLYPLWRLRGKPAMEELPVEAGASHSVSARQAGNSSGKPDGVLKTGGCVAADTVMEERTAGAPVVMARKGGERRIGEPDWTQLKAMVRDCADCKLRAGCTQTVFGVGDEQAGWLFVGEGPGADEDARGEPFVGQAGKLLDNMLLAINLRRGENVYIANIVKCRPPNNRTPEADEIAACLPYLRRQIELIKPRVIVALGKTAATALLGEDAPLGSLRGRLHDFEGMPLVVTYHPAYLLRSPSEKAKAWQDLRLAVKTAAK